MTTPENTITYHNALCLQFLLGVDMAPRETENNAYAKFWGDKQRLLWYVMVYFLEWSILKDCIKVQEKYKKVVVLCSRPRQNVKLGTFTL